MDERQMEEYEVLRMMVDDLPDGIVTTDPQGRVNEANPYASEIFGRSQAELSNQLIFQYLEDEYGAPLAEVIGRDIARSKSVSRRHVYVKRPDGSLRSCTLCVRPLIKDGEIRRVYGIFRDQTELEKNAQLDRMTGLLNEHSFNERLAENVRLARKKDLGMAVAFLDLNKLKSINQRFTHAEADRAIIMMASSLKEVVFDTDFVAHPHGDEFKILYMGLERKNVVRVAEKLAAASTFAIDLMTSETKRMERVQISAAIGICWRKGADIHDPETMVRLADRQMRLCKEGSQHFCLNLDE